MLLNPDQSINQIYPMSAINPSFPIIFNYTRSHDNTLNYLLSVIVYI